jgi:hypothetical protein
MPDFVDVMEYQNEAVHHLELLDEERPIERTVAIGIEAIVHAILAVGVRISYVISVSK